MDTVTKVAYAIQRTSCDSDEECNEQMQDYEVVRYNRILEAKAAITTYRESPEIRGLVEALEALLELNDLACSDKMYTECIDKHNRKWDKKIREALLALTQFKEAK